MAFLKPPKNAVVKESSIEVSSDPLLTLTAQNSLPIDSMRYHLANFAISAYTLDRLVEIDDYPRLDTFATDAFTALTGLLRFQDERSGGIFGKCVQTRVIVDFCQPV